MCAYNRANMLVGGNADPYCVTLGSSADLLFAGDIDGNYANYASIGNTNYITAISTSPANKILLYKMSYTDRTFTGPTEIPVTTWGPVCGWYERDCISQPGTTQGLDPIDDRLMYRTSFRKIDTQVLFSFIKGLPFIGD